MVLTLVGERFAKEGATFEYVGPAPACAPCKLKQVCHPAALLPHRPYQVTAVRAVRHPCPAGFFDGGLRVAEVAPLPVETTIPAAAARGTGVTHHFDDCGAVCLFRRLCDTPALKEGADARIVAVGDVVPCKAGRDLRFATVEPQRPR